MVAEKDEMTRENLSSVASAAMAMYSLKMAISELKEDSIFYNI
jgi:hypothetical protein